MLTHEQKVFITRSTIKQWAIEKYGDMAIDYEPDDMLVEDTVKEFDENDDDGFWSKVEKQWELALLLHDIKL